MTALNEIWAKVKAFRTKSLQATVDGQELFLRSDRYGGLYVPPWVTAHGLADEGSLFRAGSDLISGNVPGSTVAQQGQVTAFGDTTPLWAIQNTDKSAGQGGSGKRISLLALKLLLAGTAPVGTISLELAVRIDPTASKLPTSASPSLIVPVNVNGDDGTTPVAKVYAYTAAAAFATPASSGNVINAARARIPTGVSVVGDVYTFLFGSGGRSDRPGGTAARATDPAAIQADCESCMIGPGQWATIHLWWLTSGTNLPTWEWGLILAER